MSFAQKKLTFQITLGTGQFGADVSPSGGNQVTLTGLRANVHVSLAGGAPLPTADIKIFGLTQSLMNQLATLGFIPTTFRVNLISVTAQDGDANPVLVFNGTIMDAYTDYSAGPDSPFVIRAGTGMTDLVKPGQVTAYSGAVPVTTLLQNLASQFNPPLSFENSGSTPVTATLNNPYYVGSPRTQVQRICDDAGIEWNGGEGGKLAVWNPGVFRASSVPVVSPETGMIGYPSFNPMGVTVRTIFNPGIVFGGKFQIKSSLSDLLKLKSGSAGGTSGPTSLWAASTIDLSLESETPGGLWEMEVNAVPVGSPMAPS